MLSSHEGGVMSGSGMGAGMKRGLSLAAVALLVFGVTGCDKAPDQARKQMADAKALFAKADYAGAKAKAEVALKTREETAKKEGAEQLIAECDVKIAEAEARTVKIKAKLADGEKAFTGKWFDDAIRIAGEVDDLDPGNAGAAALKEKAEKARKALVASDETKAAEYSRLGGLITAAERAGECAKAIRLVNQQAKYADPAKGRPSQTRRIASLEKKLKALRKWTGDRRLSKEEITKDEFLSAAARFADTAVKHGRDVYGPKHTPLFVTYLNRELLKSPAKIPYMRVNQGCSPTPTVDMDFDESQNLFRGLVALSQCTGDPKYAAAVMEAMLYTRDNLSTPKNGLFPMGAHTGFDLITERAYCDNRPYPCIELNGCYPFFEFLYDVDPEFTSTLVKGIWEAFLIDWHGMTYNRHASLAKKPDFAKTWERPLTKVEKLPDRVRGGVAWQSRVYRCRL